MKNIPVSDTRNFAILGHSGSGKTALTDAFAFKLGLTDRQGSVDAGTSLSDYTEEEKNRKISIFASPFVAEYAGPAGRRFGINFVDTPGYMDFYDQELSALFASDAALIAVDAVGGIQVGTNRAWRSCQKHGVAARGFVITGLDRENANFAKTIEAIQAAYGSNCVPVMLPLADGQVVDILASHEFPAEVAGQAESIKSALVEQAAATCDTLIEKFLEGEQLEADEIASGLVTAVATGDLYPIFICLPLKGTGVTETLNGICRLFPSPDKRTFKDVEGNDIVADPDAPLSAIVFRTAIDTFVGQINYVRVVSGTLKPQTEMLNTSNGTREMAGSLVATIGNKKQVPIEEAGPGDIVAIPKLKDTHTGQTLAAPGSTCKLAWSAFPQPVHFAAVTAKTLGDEDMMGVLRAELGLSKNDRRFPLKGTCMDIYSRCVNARETVEETVENHFPWCRGEIEDLRRLFSAYVDHKGEQSVLDYDDLLLFWHGLLTDSRAARSVHARFDLVLVDEYQDTNRLQAEILQMLCPGGVNLTAVGDDAQAIYSFRAATVRNILDFPQQLPDTTVVTLERNYRSTQPILDATNEVMAGASERHAKDLWTERREGDKPRLTPCEDENEQTEFIIRTVLDHREAGLALRRQAGLFRASHHSLALELELARRNIPFRKYGGLRFVETAHVKDLMAFLRLAENPRDLMAGTRVLMLLPGVGPKKARALMDRLGAAPARFAAWSDCPAPSAASAEAWNGLVSLMADIASRDPGDLASQIKRIRLFYTPLLQRLYDNARARVMDLEQLEWLAARFPDRARFLAEIALDPPAYTEDLAGPPLLDEDFLILSTMHSAKGLEWDVVFVIHAADGNIPSDMATGRLEEIEEERRLFYVALTRAKDWLYVCYPVRYYSRPRSFSDAHGYAQLTRFVSDRALRLFDLQPASATLGSNGPSAPTPGDTAGQGDGVTTEDIRRRLKDLF